MSGSQRPQLVDSRDDDAKDFRRDLTMLERVDLSADLVETETTVRTLADSFLSHGLDTHQCCGSAVGGLAVALLAGGSASFTVSAGIADTNMSPRFEQLLKICDEALYAAKGAGRDQAVIGN